jgi:hypothetical protein
MSRYNTENTIKVDKEGKKSFVSKILPRIEVDDTDIFVYRIEGVGLSALAKEYYDDESLWWVIAKANNTGIRGFGIDKSLDVVRIPNPTRLNEIIQDNGY